MALVRIISLLLIAAVVFTGALVSCSQERNFDGSSFTEFTEEAPTGAPAPSVGFSHEQHLDAGQREQLNRMHFFELQESQIESLVLSDKLPWFIFFYAPWCPHCRKVAPNWKTFCVEVGKIEKDVIRLASVNCVKEQKLCQYLEIEEYPTLLLIQNRSSYKHNLGSRPDLYEDFALMGEYKKVKPKPIGSAAAPQSLAHAILPKEWADGIRQYTKLFSIASEINPLGFTVLFLLGSFVVLGLLYASIDIPLTIFRLIYKWLVKNNVSPHMPNFQQQSQAPVATNPDKTEIPEKPEKAEKKIDKADRVEKLKVKKNK